jgi:Tn7-like transposition protein D/TniQ protein
MAGFFPDPYPGELLYSACARHNDRLKYPNKRTVIQELFGAEQSPAIVDFPNRLDSLVASLPPFHQYTSDRFIDDHTLFPFYAPFLPPQRILIARDEMKGADSNRIRWRLAVNVGRLKRPSHLRFCPSCVDEDRDKVGITYWHRVHQLTGIDVCPTHAVFLENSTARWPSKVPSSYFVSAERSTYVTSPRPLDLSNSHDSFLHRISCEAAWLLTWRGKPVEKDALRKNYYNLLLERGFAYYNGRIRNTKLLSAIEEFYSREFLEKISCPLSSGDRSWPIRLLWEDKEDEVQPPIHHILLTIFLGYTLEKVLGTSYKYKPFGEGPWPCLNRASNHFGRLMITDCRVTDCLVKKKYGQPAGEFRCKCGFDYIRFGPDVAAEDRLRIDSVQSYGSIWEQSLSQFWGNAAVTVEGAAESLGVSSLTVVRHAIRLGLPMNVPGARQVSEKTIQRHKKWRRTMQDAKEDYRQEWLSLLKANPKASRNALINKESFLYLWLRKNDAEWIEAHLPVPRKFVRRDELVSWSDVDADLSVKVEAAVRHIKELPGRPIRASKAAVIREIGSKAHLEMRLDKLPLTSQVLAQQLETLEELLIRRVAWAERLYLEEGVCPTRLQFAVRIGARTKAGSSVRVQSCVDDAIMRMRSKP